jgi:hypothetical protein
MNKQNNGEPFPWLNQGFQHIPLGCYPGMAIEVKQRQQLERQLANSGQRTHGAAKNEGDLRHKYSTLPDGSRFTEEHTRLDENIREFVFERGSTFAERVVLALRCSWVHNQPIEGNENRFQFYLEKNWPTRAAELTREFPLADVRHWGNVRDLDPRVRNKANKGNGKPVKNRKRDGYRADFRFVCGPTQYFLEMKIFNLGGQSELPDTKPTNSSQIFDDLERLGLLSLGPECEAYFAMLFPSALTKEVKKHLLLPVNCGETVLFDETNTTTTLLERKYHCEVLCPLDDKTTIGVWKITFVFLQSNIFRPTEGLRQRQFTTPYSWMLTTSTALGTSSGRANQYGGAHNIFGTGSSNSFPNGALENVRTEKVPPFSPPRQDSQSKQVVRVQSKDGTSRFRVNGNVATLRIPVAKQTLYSDRFRTKLPPETTIAAANISHGQMLYMKYNE